MRTKALIPAFAGLFVFAVFSLAGQYLSLLFPALDMPWWIQLLLFLATLESAFFAAYFLNPRTPFLVRLIELITWLLPVYILVGSFQGRFIWFASLLVLAWFTAREYGSQTVLMERVADYLGDQAASTITWEFESLEQREYNSLAVEYFWWRFWFFGLSLTVLAILARQGVAAAPGSLRWRLTLLWLAALGTGLMLQGAAYLFRLQILWGYAKVRMQKGLANRWVKELVVYTLLITLAVSLAPVNYSPLPADKVGALLQSLLSRFSQSPSFDLKPPEADLNTPQEGGAPLPEIQGEPGLVGLIFGFTFLLLLAGAALVMLFVIGGALLALFVGEVDKLKGLPRLALDVYLAWRKALRAFRQWFRQVQFEFGGDLPGLNWEEGTKHLSQGMKLPGITPSFSGVRGTFRKIIAAGKKKGVVFSRAQTPAEYSYRLKEVLPEGETVIEEFFHGYHSVRYGQAELDRGEESRLIATGEKIAEQLQQLEKGE